MSDTNKQNVLDTLASENLGRFNWFEERSPRPDEVGILEKATEFGTGWQVYSTDERACPQYDRWHEGEPAALADFLEKVRATNRFFALRAKRLGSGADVP